MKHWLIVAAFRVISALLLVLIFASFIVVTFLLAGCTVVEKQEVVVVFPFPDLVTPEGLTLICRGSSLDHIREIAEYIDAVQVFLDEELDRKLKRTVVIVYPKDSLWRTDCVDGKKELGKYGGLANRKMNLTRVRWASKKKCVDSFGHELLHHAGFNHPPRKPKWPDPEARRLEREAEKAGLEALRRYREEQRKKTFKDGL